jgi:hypothetical protein
VDRSISRRVLAGASGAPEIARTHAGIAPGSQTVDALTGVANAMTLLALFPLALFCLAAGLAGLRSRALPRWLSIGALITGMSLAVNGCYRDTENVPALLAFALWCLVASLTLVRTARRERAAQNPMLAETSRAAA